MERRTIFLEERIHGRIRELHLANAQVCQATAEELAGS